MSKYATIQYNHYQICKNSTYSVYRNVVNMKCNFKQYLKMKKEHYERTKYHFERLNNWYQGKLSGLEDALYFYVESHLKWYHFIESDGKIIRFNSYEEIPKSIMHVTYSAFFWKDTDIIWSERQKING